MDLSLRLLSVCSILTELSSPTFTAQTACAAPAAAAVGFEITCMTCARTPEHYCWLPLPVPIFLAHQSLICTNSYTRAPITQLAFGRCPLVVSRVLPEQPVLLLQSGTTS